MNTLTKKPVVEFTKERFYMDHVGRHGIAALKRHINRYKWATSKLKSTDRVLDAGCGSGYGDHILLTACDTVVGVDKSSEALAYATWKADKLQQTRLVYVPADLSDFPGETEIMRPFDAVVCIEVIEHLKSAEQMLFMSNLSGLLKQDGRLYVTTPVAQHEGPRTEYHEREFSSDEFEEFLKDYFHQVTFDDPAKFGVPAVFLLASCAGVKK